MSPINTPPKHRTFVCKGCGRVAGVLLETSESGPAGSVFHSKPEADANKRPVQCRLFRALSALEYADLHEDSPPEENAVGWERA